MAFWSWSRTASSNATADITIGWAEGQAPSSINDSARAMMARTAEYRDDITGAIATGGTSTAYTVTSYEVFDTLAHMANQVIAFTPHTTSGATVTLNCDGLGAKPLRTSTGVELPAGLLVAGTPYVALYNNSDAVFYLRNFYALPYTVPIGGLLPYVGSTAPNSNFVLPFGQAVSRATYATLFGLTSTTFGTGDGSTTFNLPDLRGRSIFGLDNMGGSTASRITVAGGNFNGTTLGATGGAQNHTLSVAEMPSHDHGGATGSHSHTLATILTSGTNFNANLGGGASALAIAVSTGNLTDGATASISSQGSGTAHTILPPTMTLPYILRVI